MEYSNDRDVRVEVLRMALERDGMSGTDTIIKQAGKFEKFILGKKEDGDGE